LLPGTCPPTPTTGWPAVVRFPDLAFR
jgi:hypothetical protein